MNIIFASAHTIADEQSAEAFAMSERNLTKILLKQIVDDPDFMNSPRGISFATTISKNFTGYRTYLQRSPETISIILHRYVGAMRGLRQENALYFNELLYDNTSETYLVPRVVEKREGEEKVFQHFLFIVDGFKEHMNLKSDQPELQSFKKEHIRAFEEALCNDSVARHLFGNDFIPSPCSTR